MKHSRQVDLCKQKLIYMQPEQGVMFCPIDPATGSCVRPAFDVLLVKATDFLEESLDATGNLSVEFQPHLQQVCSRLILYSLTKAVICSLFVVAQSLLYCIDMSVYVADSPASCSW